MFFAAILLLSLAGYAQKGRIRVQVGNVKKTTALPHGVAYELSNGYAEITAYAPTTIRVRVAKQKFTSDYSFAIDNLVPSYNFKTISTASPRQVLTTDSMKVVVQTQPFRVSFYDLKDQLLAGDGLELPQLIDVLRIERFRVVVGAGGGR